MNIADTKRLSLRRLRPYDADDLLAICGDAEVMRFVGECRPLSRAECMEWIGNSQINYEKYGFGTFAVTLAGDDRVVGYAGLVRPTPGGEAEIIYGIAKDLWGRGLMSEAAAELVELGFRRFGLRRIIATIDPANAASIRIVEKLGFGFVERRTDENGFPENLYAVAAPSGSA